jgi:hypothetical protein
MSKQIFKTVLIEAFFPFASGVNDTALGVHLVLKYLREFSKKLGTALRILRGLEELFHEKT